MHAKKPVAGVTLVELLVTLGLVGAIVSAVMGFYVQSVKNGHAG